MPAGIEAFKTRKDEKSRKYSFESGSQNFSTELERKFKAMKSAYRFFLKQPPSYRKIVTHWVMSAKRAETKFLRLEKLIKHSTEQKRVSFL